MTNKEFTQIRESLSLTKKEFAQKIGATAMMVGRYENGSCKIPDSIAKTVESLVEPVKSAKGMQPSDEDIVSLIKEVRENLQLSKSALARLIGVSATAAGNYESGKNRPKDEILEKIKSLRDEKNVKKMLDRWAEEIEPADGIMPFPVENADAEADPADAKTASETAPVDEETVSETAAVKDEEAASETAAADAKAASETAAADAKAASGAAAANKEAASEAPAVEEKPESVPATEPVSSTAPSVVIESRMGGSITVDEILARLPEQVESVYVKPEENRAYWVKGDESGSVELW